MKVQEIFDLLRYGELSQLAIGTSANGDIAEADWPKLLGHIQLGLTALHRRFNLKQGSTVLPLEVGQLQYVLSGNELVDLLKLERVLTDLGEELPLNREGNPYSVFTPKANVLKLPALLADQGNDLPEVYKTESLELVYRANHPKLVVDDFDIDSTELDLPDAYTEALLYFIASRIHNPIGMTVEEGKVGMNWSARFEKACQELGFHNLNVDQGGQNDRLDRGGWV